MKGFMMNYKIYMLCMLIGTTLSYAAGTYQSTNQAQKNKRMKVLCTTAMVPPDKDRHQGIARKQRYIDTLILLKKFGCEIYVVESIASGPSFFDEYADHVCYTQSNDFTLKNHGINECIAMKIGMDYFKFDPEDMIIKLTGIYALKTDEFINLINNNPDADAIIKPWNEKNAYTALFAIKAKYFLDFLNNYIDYEWWKAEGRQTIIGEEDLFGTYVTKIKNEGARVVKIPRLYDYMPIAVPEAWR